MRIVGGRYKGRALQAPRSQAIRPTTDRTREALFNILDHTYAGAIESARVLDLFAGTGAIGLEAISRGAEFTLFVEQSAQGRGLVRSNIEALGLQGQTRLFRRDATALGSIGAIQPFDLVFADPPYGKGIGERALSGAAKGGWLHRNALVILEERSDVEPVFPEEFSVLESRKFGDTTMHFLRFEPASARE